MMIINFIRHGETEGNRLKKYIGKTDEELSESGKIILKETSYPECEFLFTSPMRRCIQTCEIIYPNKKYEIHEDLRECDFGDFEGKNYIMLNGNEDYQKWIDSGGKNPFPNGESPEEFKERSIFEFMEITNKTSDSDVISFVVHGGTIMSVMERFSDEHKSYYDYHVENGHGYKCLFDGKSLKILERI